MCTKDLTDFHHQLWLIYSQLKDAETDAVQRLELLEYSREKLGKVLNELIRQTSYIPYAESNRAKSLCPQAANLNCRDRQKDLTPDNIGRSARI